MATYRTLGVREATMQDPGNASILRCSDSAVEPDAATEHIAPASFGSAGEASSGCGDMTIKSLDDVVSKLSSDCDEPAAALLQSTLKLSFTSTRHLRRHFAVYKP